MVDDITVWVPTQLHTPAVSDHHSLSIRVQHFAERLHLIRVQLGSRVASHDRHGTCDFTVDVARVRRYQHLAHRLHTITARRYQHLTHHLHTITAYVNCVNKAINSTPCIYTNQVRCKKNWKVRNLTRLETSDKWTYCISRKHFADWYNSHVVHIETASLQSVQSLYLSDHHQWSNYIAMSEIRTLVWNCLQRSSCTRYYKVLRLLRWLRRWYKTTGTNQVNSQKNWQRTYITYS